MTQHGQINLKELRRTGQKEVNVDETFTFEDLPLKQPAHVTAHLRVTSTGATVRGHMDAVLEEPCDRCLEPFERPVSTTFDELYVYESLTDTSLSGDIELKNEDFYEIIGPDGIVDLADLAHQHLVLAISSDRMCNRDTCEMNPA